MVKSDNSTPYLAADYDSQVRSTIPYYEAFHEETINLIRAMRFDPNSWLDTGCGTGTLAQRLLTAFPKTQFVLVDPAAEMLNKAKVKLSNNVGRVKFLEPADTQDLPKGLGRFDVITAIQSHHYINREERNKATSVCFELLKPAGVYITFENIRPLTSKGTAIGKENWKNFQLAKGRETAEVQKHLERFDVEYHPVTIEEHLSLLRGTGFATVEMLWYSYMQAGFYAIKKEGHSQ